MSLCKSQLREYAVFLNNANDNKSDNVPFLLTWNDYQCKGTYYPRSGSSYNSKTLNEGQVYPTSEISTDFHSLFIPFNIRRVTFSDTKIGTKLGTNRISFHGGTLIEDIRKYTWNGTMNRLNEKSFQWFQIEDQLDWENEAVSQMCMGYDFTIGSYHLSRYEPHKPRCDYFMSEQFCGKGTVRREVLEECACFRESEKVNEKTLGTGIALPVTCFGETCSLGRSYKTQQMIVIPCSFTVCEQNISQGNVNAQGESTIYCNGQMYDTQGKPKATKLNDNSIDQKEPIVAKTQVVETSESFYTWIILGVSGVLFLLLIFLLFSPINVKRRVVVGGVKDEGRDL